MQITGQFEFDIIASPNGWLDCTIIQEAQILLKKINTNIEGFQRPTLGPAKQFHVMTAELIQLLHVNGNHWVCMTSIGCTPGDVNLLDNKTSDFSRNARTCREFAWVKP